MSDELPTNLRPVVDFFGLVGTAQVVKDFHVVRAIRAIAALDAVPFALIFGGGTALARAHKIISRMSEDVDFKTVPLAAAPVSRNALHRALGGLRSQVTVALESAGFVFDPMAPTKWRSRNDNRYTIWHLPYEADGESAGVLRPTIQIELTYAPLRQSSVPKPVASFIAEAFSRPPEIPKIACVSLTETAAEKLVSLTRRTAMERAGLSENPDPALVRHIYDLHILRDHVDLELVVTLAREIAVADALEFRNQYPAYAADMARETSLALAALQSDPAYRRRYDDFVAAMVYGESLGFDTALNTVVELATKMIQKLSLTGAGNRGVE